MVLAETRPVGSEMKALFRLRKAGEEMGVPERRHGIDPTFAQHRCRSGPAGCLQRGVDDFHRGHLEATMFGTETVRQSLQEFVIGPALSRRFDPFRTALNVAMAAGLISVLV